MYCIEEMGCKFPSAVAVSVAERVQRSSGIGQRLRKSLLAERDATFLALDVVLINEVNTGMGGVLERGNAVSDGERCLAILWKRLLSQAKTDCGEQSKKMIELLPGLERADLQEGDVGANKRYLLRNQKPAGKFSQRAFLLSGIEQSCSPSITGRNSRRAS